MATPTYSAGRILYSQRCFNIYHLEERPDSYDYNQKFWTLKSYADGISIPIPCGADYSNLIQSIIGIPSGAYPHKIDLIGGYESSYIYETRQFQHDAPPRLTIATTQNCDPKYLIHVSRYFPSHIEKDFVEYGGRPLTSDIELATHAILSKILRTATNYSIAPTDTVDKKSRFQVRNLYTRMVDEILDIVPMGIHLLYAEKVIPYHVPTTKEELFKALGIQPLTLINHDKLKTLACDITEGRVFSSFGLDLATRNTVFQRYTYTAEAELMAKWVGEATYYAPITPSTSIYNDRPRFNTYDSLNALESKFVDRYIKQYVKKKIQTNSIPVQNQHSQTGLSTV